jgi:type I restriction enzyme M protein
MFTTSASRAGVGMVLPPEKFGPVPAVPFTVKEHTKNNLPDVLNRWEKRDTSERKRAWTEPNFCVPKADIAAEGYDLSLNCYKEVMHEVLEHRKPSDILANLSAIEETCIVGGARRQDHCRFVAKLPPALPRPSQIEP